VYFHQGFWLKINDCQSYQIGTWLIVIGSHTGSNANNDQMSIWLETKQVIIDYGQNFFLDSAIRNTQKTLFAFRFKIYSRISKYLLQPEAGLFFSLIFGGNSFLTPEIKQQVLQAGVTHLVAASGSNISLLLLLINYLSRQFSRKNKLFLNLAAIFVYAHLANLAISIMRASLMGALHLLASGFYRKSHILLNLAVTATIILFFVEAAVSDIGFQLSFMAVLGIVVSNMILTQNLEGIFSKLETIDLFVISDDNSSISFLKAICNAFKESLFLSLIVNLWIWPITVYHFGQINLVGVLSSVCLTWLILPIYLYGLIYVCLLFINLYFEILNFFYLVFSLPLQVLLDVFLKIVVFFNQFDFLILKITSDNVFLLGSWYPMLITLLFLWRKMKNSAILKNNKLINYEKLFSF